MSPRAAWRLEQWGFEDVSDYVGGKEDWLAYLLPREGEGLIAGDVLRTEVATCGLGSTVGDVGVWASGALDGPLVVLGANRVVLGAVSADALDADSEDTIAEVMTEGPTTVRPSEELGGLVERMADAHVDTLIVTSSDGRFLGLLDRVPAERLLERAAEHQHQH